MAVATSAQLYQRQDSNEAWPTLQLSGAKRCSQQVPQPQESGSSALWRLLGFVDDVALDVALDVAFFNLCTVLMPDVGMEGLVDTFDYICSR